MHITQSPLFQRTVKKFSKLLKQILDENINQIKNNPAIGVSKKGDLKGVKVHKFKFHDQQYLLAYRVSENLLELIAINSHENFYRDLKMYM